jgi:metal-responsive CopG/Arc/MetJ family transcriptional regulator
MPENLIKVILNQQQLELVDKTIERGTAADRQALIRLALREFTARHAPGNKNSAADTEK